MNERFRAVFDDPDRFVAVLDAGGAVESLNDAAVGFLGQSRDAVLGEPLWALPWEEASRRDVRTAVERAAEGAYVEFEGVLPGDGTAREGVTLDVRLQPVDAGETGVLAQGAAVTERERLEAELRASEELHRVTLNNMTDTVLVTDDDGEFTYVCPNVHFIFGYSAEELYEFGSIDELLGEDVFDPDRLASEGVLTNVECTATDESGDEHTLLVNVRRVDIQGGTTLYSCRDITKRKQRERALAELQRASRDLLFAETDAGVADRVVAAADTALADGGLALYRFDGRENVLDPIAATDYVREAVGPLPAVGLDRDTCVSRAFVDERTTTRADGEGARPFREAFDDHVAIPLGEHGVVFAATEAGDVDGVDREVAELLAATAEAAFDRLDRERELRERDERLQRQNRRLSELNEVNELIREVDQALVHADSRAEIEEAVCERLTTEDRFAFAWVGEATARNRRVRPRAWAGDGEGYLDSVSLSTADGGSAAADGGPTAEPTLRTVDDGSATLVSNVADCLHEAAWCKEAVSQGFASVLSIPFRYDGVLLGTLTVYDDDPNAVSDTVRAVFAELGDTIGAAINSVQRKEALRSDSIFRLTYRLRDDAAPLQRLAGRFDCTLGVESEVIRDDDTTLAFVAVDGASPEAVVDGATSLVEVADGDVVRDGEDGGLVSLEVVDPLVASTLADRGAVRQTFEATSSGLELVVDVPDAAAIRAVDERLAARYDDVELRSQRKRARPTGPRLGDASLLTDRQREVAQVAYHSSFFDADRNVTGRDVAEMLDISHTAFYDHVRRIERKLFAALFERRPDSRVE